MGYQLFSEEWAVEFCKMLNSNEAYRAQSAGWESPLILRLIDGKEDQAVFLDLWHGRCRSARPCTDSDFERADYVVSARREVWFLLYRQKMDPVYALMRGKLKLEKGSLVRLMKFTGAAKELLASASAVVTEFDMDETGPAEPAVADTGSAHSGSVGNGSPVRSARGLNGLDFESFPMRLYQKAKKLGVWNPSDIHFEADREDWRSFDALEQEVLLHLTSLFLAGEEAVTEDLLPLMMAVSREHRVEEELYLTSFLWEEGKHTEFFNLFLREIGAGDTDLSRFHGPPYKQLFYVELPRSMNRLLDDPSPVAQLEASVTYNMIVEGVLAETGYHAYYEMLERNDLLPGLRQGIGHLKRDESRHIAYGIYLLSRLVSEHPGLWEALERRMQELLEIALNVINDIFDTYDELPFGLKKETFVNYAMSQFGKRLDRIESSGNSGREELLDSFDE